MHQTLQSQERNVKIANKKIQEIRMADFGCLMELKRSILLKVKKLGIFS